MNVRLKRARELAGYAVQLTKDEGLGTMLARGAGFVRRRCFGKKARYLPAKKVLEAQRAEMAGKNFENCQLSTISVLTPLYNTPEVFLRQFLDSFVNQTAPNGELCLADASDAAHSSVGNIVREYQTKYQHIVYKKIENKGIAANTNAAAELAAGEYLALADHLERTGRTGTIEDGLYPSTYRVRWDIVGEPKVSILIPNKDHTEDLEKCLQSIWKKTTWNRFEVIVIENNSTDPATFAYYEKARQRYDGLKVVTYPGKGFNFSAINNFGRKAAEGDYLLLLNNDVEVVNGDWLTELLRQCAHPGGAAICGAMLWYPDETIQHAGIVTGLGGYAGHSHKYKKKGGSGYLFRTSTVQDFSGVTGACLLVKTAVYDEMHGLDEQFAVAFNDVDFCLRVRDAGYRIAWTPYAELIHYESKSRGGDEKDPVKAARFAAEQQRLYTIHGKENILDDPYYNPNLTRDREDFSESDDLRRLKEGRVTVRFRGGTLQ